MLPAPPSFAALFALTVVRWCGALALAGLAAGCAMGGPAGRDTVLPAVPTLQPQVVAPGVYLLPGVADEADPANGGRVGNVAFVVGPQGVLVVDAGTSFAHGQAVLAAVARVTPLPVKLVVLTHVKQEVVFGAAAFQQQGIAVAMHEAAARLMAARCETCLKNLKRLLGDAAMAGTRVVRPDRLLVGGEDVGALIGRPLTVLYAGHTSGPGDIALLDAASGLLFTGAMLDVASVPDIQDARLAAWQDQLSQWQARAARGELRRVLPTHGPLADAAPALAVQQAYLAALQRRVRELLAADSALSDVAEAADLPEYAGWARYASVHRRNAAMLFVRLEAEALNAAAAAPNGPDESSPGVRP
jgi:glyoxylase-like metal-dependent hydrolase (beta-lactamase superfamily II)